MEKFIGICLTGMFGQAMSGISRSHDRFYLLCILDGLTVSSLEPTTQFGPCSITAHLERTAMASMPCHLSATSP